MTDVRDWHLHSRIQMRIALQGMAAVNLSRWWSASSDSITSARGGPPTLRAKVRIRTVAGWVVGRESGRFNYKYTFLLN